MDNQTNIKKTLSIWKNYRIIKKLILKLILKYKSSIKDIYTYLFLKLKLYDQWLIELK